MTFIRRTTGLGVAALALLLTAACSGSSPTASADPTTVAGSSTGGGTTPQSPSAVVSTPTAATAPVTKLLTLVIENRSLAQMRAQMPYTFGLAQQYGYATDYHAIRHPSLPNYLSIAGGSTFGVADDNPPSSHVATGPSVFGEAIAHGKTAKIYADGMTSNCELTPSGLYGVKHNAWAYFVDERALCQKYDVPIAALDTDIAAGTLPNASMVIPDMCHDAHNLTPDCSLTDADAWMKTVVGKILAGPDFRSGHLAVVVTADEDSYRDNNLILTTVFHPSQHHHVVTTPLTHDSLSRLYSQVLGVAPLHDAATATDMAAAFGLPLPKS